MNVGVEQFFFKPDPNIKTPLMISTIFNLRVRCQYINIYPCSGLDSKYPIALSW